MIQIYQSQVTKCFRKEKLQFLIFSRITFLNQISRKIIKEVLVHTDQLLVFKISNIENQLIREILLSISPIRKIINDYNEICLSYYNAVKRLTPSQIETIDMGRKAIHDEGGRILIDRFNRKADMDFQTSRRLFTLITAIYLESVK